MNRCSILPPQKVATPVAFTALANLWQRKCACGGTPDPTGECAECRKKRLQRKSRDSQLGSRNDSSVPPIVREVLRSPGQSLDPATRTLMEQRFGRDFSHVRMHTGLRSTECAQTVGSLALLN